MACDYSQPIEKFKQQARQAKQRGIDWQLTFDQWWAIWQDSGKWEQRGKRRDQFVMARQGDVGPYSVENVFICSASKNHSDAHANGRVPVRKGTPGKTKSGRVFRGWTFVKRATSRPYQVMFRDKYIGSFATQEEAERAYLAARIGVEGRIHEGPQFCPSEPLNTTQLICEVM